MANKRKTGDAPEWTRELMKSLGVKSDFQKRAISGEDFGKYNDFGQSEKQKPSVPKKPNSKPESKAEDKPKNDYASKIAGYYDEYNKKLAEAKRESKDETPTKRQSAATGSALSRARESKLLKSEQGNKSATAQGTRNKIGENMAKIASGDGKTNADLKLMGQINKLKREYQWEEAGRRYDALSDEEKQALYRRRNSSALDRARMSLEEEDLGGRTAQETRNKIGENIAKRYYELEDKLNDPTKGGEYAIVNRVRSAAGEAAENIGKWLYDSFGYEPGKEVYEKGEARKIGEIANKQFANEMATNPTKSYQTAVQVSDSLANMLSYKIATGPLSLFAGSVASEAAFGKEIAKGASYTKAAEVAAEKGSHAANSIFTSGMAFGTFGDTYNQSRAEGQGKLESTIRATAAGAISYITEAMGGIGGSKSPLNKLESAAKQKWITNLLYNAFEEGGEELVEYSLNYLTQGVIDLAAQGKWNQVYDLEEVLNNFKVGFWSGGIFGLGNVALAGGQQIVNKLGNNANGAYTGNAEADAKLDRAKNELLDNLITGYQASQDPIVKAEVEAQLDAMVPDTVQQAPTSPAESVSSVAGNVQAEAQTQQKAPAQAEQKAPKKKPSKKEAKHEEMLDQLDVRAAEKKAAQEAPARQEVETTAQPKQEAPQQVQKPTEVKSEAETKAPQKAPQQGAQLKADRDTVKRAYKDFSNTSMKQSRFEALYNEAYNAESFEAFTKKHPSFGEKLKGAMQKAFENGQRARDGANAKALSDNGIIMNEDDAFLLNSRKNVDSLIARYKEEADNGMYWDEAESGDAIQLRLEESEIAARREAIKKLEAYRDENFSQKTEQKTEKQAPKKKPVSTEKKLEKTIQTLENYKKHLENGDMAKLEQKNPDRYSEMMYKLEQITADENGSDYFYDADEVSVLIDKYKEKLELVRAQNGAQAENVRAQAENVRAQKSSVDNIPKFEYNKSSQYATVAPYYNTEVTAENKQQVKEAVNKVFTDNAKNTAKILGIKLKGETSNMGGFTFSEGEAAGQQVHEISYSFEFEDATPEQAQLFASLMAENGYEQQEAAIQKRYVANIDEGNAYEYTIRYRNMDEFAVAKALEKAGITDYTIDTTNGIIQILEFDIEKNTEIRNSIDTLLNNEEGSFYGTNYNPIQSEYLDETSRAGLYRSWLEKGEQDGERRNYISEALRKVEERITENERVKTENKTKADAESVGSFNAQNSAAKAQQNSENAAKTQQNEYSPEYQNGAEHPETVGAMESDKQNITRAINENGALPQKKKPFSDFDRYKADNDIPSGERAALARKINDPMLGEITVAQNIANLAKDGAKFIEQDGKYYAQNKESSVRVSKSAYNYGKWLNDNGVFYTLNQNAEVPKKINGKYVSKSVTTFIASRGGTDAMVESIAAKIESGETGYVYDKKSHKEVLRYAQDTIVDKGFDGAVEYFNEMALGDHKYTSEINTLGIMLKNIASEAYMDSKGKNKDALDLATQIQAWIATNQTNAGQVTESMKIDRQLINNNSELYYQSLIESLQKKYEKRLKGKEITLDTELLRKVAETAGTKEYTKWADKLNASIANQIPATALERFNAYRYFCMLSSFRTDAKNIISNDIQFVMAIQKNLWLSAAERIYKKKHPEYMLTTSGFKTDISKAKFASEVFGKENTGGSKYENKENWVRANRTNTFQGNGKLNKINIPGHILDFMANTKTKMLSAEDVAAKKALFVNRFVQVMEANHWTTEFLSDKSNPEAIKAYEKATSIAMEEALKGTFNDQSAMVQLLTQWKNIDTKNSDTTFAAGKVAVATIIETMFPFKNVPFNVAGSAIRYSPFGLFAGVCDLKKVKNGNLDARVALENISKGMTGTTVSLGGTLLAMLGMLTLGRDEDEDKPIEEKKDTTMYLKIPDKKNGDLYIDIDWIDSVSMQLRTGLELYDIFKQKIKGKSGKESEEEIADFWGTAIGLATRGMDSFMDIGMMASFSNLLLNKSGARTFGDVFTNQVTNLETQLIPRIVTDIRQALDKEKRNTYYKDKTGKDSEYPKWIQWIASIVPQSARNQYRAAFGDREKLPARLDEWGNSLGEEDAFKRAAEALIIPSKTYRANDDRVQQMLDQLDAKTDKNVFPPDYPKQITVQREVGGKIVSETINLSGKEYEEVARKIGKERYKLLDELGKDREFQKLSPDKKAELIQDCYNIANEMAKYGFDDDYSISKITQDVKDAKKEKLSIPKYLRAKQAYDNMSEYEKDGVKISRSYQFADYLMKDTSTTVEEDIKLIELIERKKDGNKYKSPFENIRKVPDTSDKEMLSLYVAFRDQADKEQDLQSYMLEYGYNSEQALARYNVAKGSKATYDSLGNTQKKKADKLLAAANKGRTANEWNEEKIALAASAVTSVGSFGTKKTQKSYIAMLMAVGFTESEAKEFYKYYA